MLSNIQSARKPAAESDDPIDLLLGCHQRIRHFTAVALRMAESPDAPPAQISEAANSVLRYYQVALPLHEADENDSIHPRLRKALPPGELATANESMVKQHVDIDALIAELVPLWRALRDAPQDLPSLAPALRHKTARLERLWQLHLGLEEEQVVPAMRKYLREEELDAIRAEMVQRRR
jgi:hemerythrin HHE cation binding domain-containing protein